MKRHLAVIAAYGGLVLGISAADLSRDTSSEADRFFERVEQLRGKWNQTLRDALSKADSVRIVRNWYKEDGRATYMIADPKAVRALVAVIEVDDNHRGQSVGCLGRFQYQFLEGESSVATISEACGCLFWSDGPWVGTPLLTPRSVEQIAEWVHIHVPEE